MLKKLMIIILGMFVINTISYAGTKGSASVPFLNITPDARGAAMGESLTALTGDVNAGYWNPAGLAYASGIQGSLTHLIWIFDTSYDYLAGSYKLAGAGTIGLNMQMVSLPSIEDKYLSKETYNSGDFAITGSFGKNLKPIISLPISAGVNVKYISEKLAGVSGSGIGFDIGGIYAIDETIKAGFILENVGTKIKFGDYENSLPMVVKVGAAYILKFKSKVAGYLEQVNTGLSLNLPSDNDFGFNLGGEGILSGFAPDIQAAIRLGVSYPREGSFFSYLNFGAGVMWKMLRVDYAFANMGTDLDAAHRISLGVKF